MNEESRSGDAISATVSGEVTGQVAVGKGITQTQSVGTTGPTVTEADLAELRGILADLKTRVEVEVTSEQKQAALEKVAELEEAVIAKEPDLITMEYVKSWFIKHLPALAGTVTSVVVHPIVGKLVEAAGDALAVQLHHRFGRT